MMNKRILSCLIACIMLLAAGCVNVFGDEASHEGDERYESGRISASGRVWDNDYLLDQEETDALGELVDEISEKYIFDVVIAATDSYNDMTDEEFADDYYDKYGFGQGDYNSGLIFVISYEEGSIYSMARGYGSYVFDSAGLSYIQDIFLKDLEENNPSVALTTYVKWVHVFLQQALTGEPYGEGHLPDGDEVEMIPSERLKPLVVDDADLLSDEEESALLSKLESISKNQQCEVAVVTVDSLEGKTSEAYADDFYDYNGYGYGEDDDGILLLIAMEDRDWAITTYGFGITAFTDAGQEYIVGKFKPDLSSGDYGAAFNEYADRCDEFLTQARSGEPYDGELLKEKIKQENALTPEEKRTGLIVSGIISLIAGALAGCGLGSRKKKKQVTVLRKIDASNYVANVDKYIDSIKKTGERTHIVDKKEPRSDSSSSSSDNSRGSTTHVSSSGRSHGGSHGKF